MRSPPPGADGGKERAGLRSRMSARDQATRDKIREGVKGFGRLVADTWKARVPALFRLQSPQAAVRWV